MGFISLLRGVSMAVRPALSRRFFIAGSLSMLAAPGGPAVVGRRSSHRAPPGQLKLARNAAAAAMKRTKAPGVSLATIANGKIATAQLGVKRAGSRDPVDQSTVFSGASLSKPIFGYIVLTLVQEKRLELDAPISTYGPLEKLVPAAFLLDDPRLKRVTPRMLLEHTHAIGWTWIGPADDRARLGQAKMVGEPGAAFRYAPQGYALLQSVVEKVLGTDLETLARARVFHPFGMSRSSYLWQPSFSLDAATGHTSGDVPGPNPGDPNAGLSPDQLKRMRSMGLGGASAAGSLTTTAADYARFVQGVLAGLDGRSPLSPTWTRSFLTPHVRVTDKIAWGPGLGFVMTSLGPIAWHYGNLGAFQNVGFFPTRARPGFTAFVNSDQGLAVERAIASSILPEAVPAFDWIGVPPP
jgi:CubicO group peptidase (beta-lactamase class C family)